MLACLSPVVSVALVKALRLMALVSWLVGGSWTLPPACGCTVPVFRYALERWEPGTHLALVFHRGPLTPEQERSLQQLARTPDGKERSLNLEIQRVDLAQPQPADVQAVYQRAASNGLPWMVVLCPDHKGRDALPSPALSGRSVAWSGPLRTEALERMADSPARRDIARRLLRGDAVVWVLAECGDAAKDNAAVQMLAAELPKLEKRLALAPPEGDVAEEAPAHSTNVPLRVAFSYLRLAAHDPQEVVLAQLLTEAFPGPRTQPVVLPVFGRGRALIEFLPAPLGPEAISEAAAFLVGECSCLIKELNPGLDLLMPVNWEEVLDGTLALDHALPPLTGVLPLPRSGSAPGPKDAALGPARPLPAGTPGLLRRNTLLVLALALTGIGVATALVLRRTRKS
jgi:hypothetical protein